MHSFVREVSQIGSWDRKSAMDWWHRSIDAGLASAIERWAPGAAAAVWSLWAEAPEMIKSLASAIASSPTSTYDELTQACPETLSKAVADQVADSARTYSWPEIYALAIAASYGPEPAVERLLATPWQDVTQALERLAIRYGGGLLVRLATTLDEPRLSVAAAREINQNPALLAPLDPTNRAWRRLWHQAIELGADPWAGIPGPLTVRAQLLDQALDKRDFETPLLTALGRTGLADLTDYPRRQELWAVLPEPARSRFLAATASAWIARFRSAPEGEPVAEEEILAMVRSDPSLLVVEGTDPGFGLRAAIAAFDRLSGWREQDIVQWIRRVDSSLDLLPQPEAFRFGRMVANRGWREVAKELFSRRRSVALRTAVGECLDLLGIFDRLLARIEGLGLGNTLEVDWYDALIEFAVRHYPTGPNDEHIWIRAGGEYSRLRGRSGHERWRHAVSLLRSGGAGSSITHKGLIREMIRDYPHNDHLKVLYDSSP
jgi:hypothetical protein